jgi:coenzyme F420-reducing hydrogenase alpha subunit
MDLKLFYKKIREVERTITDEYPLLTSLSTEDGGKAGMVIELPRYQAARMIVEGKARLASEEEISAYEEQLKLARKIAEEFETARRLHLSILGSAEQRIFTSSLKKSK